MKFRLIVMLVEKVLGVSIADDQPRADMYLPEKLLAFAIVLLAAGSGLGIASFFQQELWMSLCEVGGIGMGILALLCWKNQTIRVISDTHFEYTTFLGNTYTYAFKDITGLRQNKDSMTLFVGSNKVHMESMAIISQRLADAINQSLQQRTE